MHLGIVICLMFTVLSLFPSLQTRESRRGNSSYAIQLRFRHPGLISFPLAPQITRLPLGMFQNTEGRQQPPLHFIPLTFRHIS
jgi:hypothetical protein